MELILVRHGQPAWSDPDGFGRNDPELTELGRRQAELAARRLANSEELPGRGDIDRVFASPAVRAQQTAAPIAAALGLEIVTLDWLLEVQNPPEWEGSPMANIDAAFQTMYGQPRETWWAGHPGGENFASFHERIRAGITATLAELGITPSGERGLWDVAEIEAGLDRVVMVAHGGTNGAVVANLLQVEPEPWEWERFRNGHAAFSVLHSLPIAGHHIWSLDQVGDANHLPVADRTF
ncbi:MAG TPA: histidine phosphatase family protein [Ilumatobacteraceae bacterium]|nr:histidine phosphatase family protein [Ilumatobacteraceae bacterium]